MIKKIVKKSSRQWEAYWSLLLFSGKGTPPEVMANDQEVINRVMNIENTIGYVSSEAVLPNEVNKILFAE